MPHIPKVPVKRRRQQPYTPATLLLLLIDRCEIIAFLLY